MPTQISSGRPIRVAQWATGSVGANALRAVIRHPQLQLVAVKVYAPAKEGKDAGELCGEPPTGVKATRSIEVILAAKPDCVLYMADRANLDDVCRLLEAGINVVTTRGEFFNPQGSALRERVESACRKGNASIHATGSSPGFITEALPLVLTSMSRRLDFLGIDEFADCLAGCSEQMLTDILHFGGSPDDVKRDFEARDEVFQHSLNVLATALGTPIDRFEMTTEVALCRSPTKLHTITIPAGSVGAQRGSITGVRDDKPFVRFRSNWFVTTDIEPAWELRKDGWRVVVEGDTPMNLTIDLPMPQETGMVASGRYTAHRPVNAIPYVCAARQGIVTTADLPQIIARLA